MLCSTCKTKMFSPASGVCTGCGGSTSARQHKLCGSCSKRENRCKACGTSLASSGAGAKPQDK